MAKHLKYSDNLDYLMASIIYLGTQKYWWARTPRAMAEELSLDETRLKSVFEGFPGIFRESNTLEPKIKQHMYSLQARYAQKKHSDPPDKQLAFIEPLDMEKLRALLDFIFKVAEDERSRSQLLIGNAVAVGAAIVSAITAVITAYLSQ